MDIPTLTFVTHSRRTHTLSHLGHYLCSRYLAGCEERRGAIPARADEKLRANLARLALGVAAISSQRACTPHKYTLDYVSAGTRVCKCQGEMYVRRTVRAKPQRRLRFSSLILCAFFEVAKMCVRRCFLWCG